MQLLNDFKQYLITSGKSADTASLYTQRIAKFLKDIAEPRIEKITEELAGSYIAGIKDRRTKHGYAATIRQFLQFTSAHPSIVVVEDQALQSAGQNQQEPTMPLQWLVEKLIDDKSRTDDLLVKLVGKLMDHYLYFQSRIKGEGENKDNICRLADETRHLIESNLEVFFHLSSGRQKDSQDSLERFYAAGRRLTSHW